MSDIIKEEGVIQPSDEDLQRLKKALDFSNTMKTFNLSKNNLKVKTQNLLLLDKNDIPIRIEDTEKFLEEVSSLYFEAVNDYYNEYQQLRSSRKIEKVLEI